MARRIIIVGLLAALTLTSSHPAPAQAASRTITVDTVQAYGGIWLVQQRANFTITSDTLGRPTRLTLNWAHCTFDSILIGIAVTWCGGVRESALRFDMGFNFTKTAFWLVGSQACWARARVAATSRYGVYVNAERRGC